MKLKSSVLLWLLLGISSVLAATAGRRQRRTTFDPDYQLA